MNDKAAGMVLASFAADSFALGYHWIYDTAEIDRKFGRPKHLAAPLPDSFHPGKKAGDFTHYGDQTLWLLESLAAKQTFDMEHFAHTWKKSMSSYRGYVDKASKTTLANMESGREIFMAGSHSADLGGAARIAPLVYFYSHDEETLAEHAIQQTDITHNNAQVQEAAAFFARAASYALAGAGAVEALNKAAEKGFENKEFELWFPEAMSSAALPTRYAIKTFGQHCPISGAFPSTVHLIARYPENYKDAMIENVLAGGDSAARGMLAGMVIAAANGKKALVVDEWIDGMRAKDWIVSLLKALGDARDRSQGLN